MALIDELTTEVPPFLAQKQAALPVGPPETGAVSSSADSVAAAAVVAEAVVIAAEADATLAQEAIDVAAAEVLAAAGRAAVAAERARGARAFAAALAADAVAQTARQAAEAERARVNAAAERVSAAATQAAQTILDSGTSDRTGHEASAAAEGLAAVVAAAAEASAQDAARAAASMADAVAEAAAAVASTLHTIDIALEGEFAILANDLAEVATATARRLAVVTEKRVEGTARLARQAGAAAKSQAGSQRPDTTYWAVQASFSAERWSPANAREFVGVHLLEHDCPDLVEDIRLIVSELATNAVVHAQTPFSVTMVQSDGLLTLAVQDGSPAIPTKSLGGVIGVHGRGMTIVQQLSLEWGVTGHADNSKSVWASFRTTKTEMAGSPRKG